MREFLHFTPQASALIQLVFVRFIFNRQQPSIMGSSASKDESTSANRVGDATSGGFHMLELHMPSMGMGAFTIALIALTVMAIMYCFRRLRATPQLRHPSHPFQFTHPMAPHQLAPYQLPAAPVAPRYLQLDPRVIRALAGPGNRRQVVRGASQLAVHPQRVRIEDQYAQSSEDEQEQDPDQVQVV